MKVIEIRTKLKNKKISYLEWFITASGERRSIGVIFFGVRLFSMVGNKFMVVANWEEVSIDL